ncbi:MAG: hypothetical protein ACP5FH_07105 [Terracidiphilus sp.]
MQAFDLIDSIFSRPARGAEAKLRRITRRQLVKLRELIDEDPERTAVRRGDPGSLVWSPTKGKHKYVLTEDPEGGEKHTLARLGKVSGAGTGNLF